jgi:glycosyltransferase involved in cell wall biosynthesis
MEGDRDTIKIDKKSVMFDENRFEDDMVKSMPQDPLNILCIEPHYPGRLGGVADWLVRRRGYKCSFYCHKAGAKAFWPASTGRGMDVIAYNVGGAGRESSVTWQRSLERSLCYSFGAWEVINSRRPRPIDVVLGRSDGLGSSLFAPVYTPRTPVVQLFDYYYHSHEHDLSDEMGPGTPPAYYHWRNSTNAIDLLDLENGVLPWAPTAWQRDLYPPEYRDDFFVLHDGIDARIFKPRTDRSRIISGRTIPDGAKIVTFVARCLDQLRGFDRFLRLANALIRQRSDVIAVVVGDPQVTRTLDVSFHGKSYRDHLLKTHLPTDPDRLWFTGAVTQETLAEIFARSDLHIYPSRTYPVSRSLIQAMASGCVILASDDAPVREIIRHDIDGLLVKPDDPDAWFESATRALDDQAGHRPLGDAARGLVLERFDRDVTLPSLAARLNQLAGLGG